MRKSFASEEIKTKRQKLVEGIYLEHYQQLVDGKNLYILKMEVLTSHVVHAALDFSKSARVELKGEHSEMVKRVELEPFTKVIVAKLKTDSEWIIRLHIRLELHRPSLQAQAKLLAPYETDLREKAQRNALFEQCDLSRVPETTILTALKEKSMNFVDLEFPPFGESWCRDFKGFEETHRFKVQWRRARYVYLPFEQAIHANKALPEFFFKPVNAEKPVHCDSGDQDVNKAVTVLVEETHEDFKLVSDFCSAKDQEESRQCIHHRIETVVNALIDYPEILKNLIANANPNTQGFYRLNLFKLGKHFPLIVDDYIPCFPIGRPIGAHFSRDQVPCFGTLLIEKALAKLRGSYEAPPTSTLTSLLIDITGFPTFAHSLNSDSDDKLDLLWIRLQAWRRQGQLVFAQHKSEDSIAANSPAPWTSHNGEYCVIEHVQMDESNDRLVILRRPNICLSVLSDDAFAEDSILALPNKRDAQIFERSPTITPKDPSSLVVPLTLLAKDLFSLVVCQLNYAHKIRIKGKFVTPPHHNSLNCEHGIFTSRYAYEFSVNKETQCTIGVHQEDESWAFVAETRPHIDIGLIVFKMVDGQAICMQYVRPQVQREVFAELLLEPGKYWAIPLTIGMHRSKISPNLNGSAKPLDFKDPRLQSVVNDIFDKFNISGSGYLFFEELQMFFKTFQVPLGQEKFNALVQNFVPGLSFAGKPQGLDRKAFAQMFGRLLGKNQLGGSPSQAFKILGYDDALFSFGSRVFGFTVHSSEYMTLDWKDAIGENVEELVFEALLGREGKEVASARLGDFKANALCAALG